MRLLIFISLFTLCCCSTRKIINETPAFIDIEAKREDVWIGCTEYNSEYPDSLMTFYVKHQNTTHEFTYRRLDPHDFCKKVEGEYRNIVGDSKRIRISGLQPIRTKSLLVKTLPEKFNKSPKKIGWTFLRMKTGQGCKGYFDQACDPKSYWGNTYPKGHEYWKSKSNQK